MSMAQAIQVVKDHPEYAQTGEVRFSVYCHLISVMSCVCNCDYSTFVTNVCAVKGQCPHDIHVYTYYNSVVNSHWSA